MNEDWMLRESRFKVDSSTGVILDKKTHLEWMVYAHSDVNYYNMELSLKQFQKSGWRLPIISELKELYDAGISSCISEDWLGPFKHSGDYIWTSETIDDDGAVRVFSFDGGSVLELSRTHWRFMRGFYVRSRASEDQDIPDELTEILRKYNGQ